MRVLIAALAALSLLPFGGPAGADEPSPPAAGATLERRAQARVVAHEPDSSVPVHGPRYAPVTIEFFLNLTQYRDVRDIHRRLMELRARHPRRLRIVYRIEAQRGRTYIAEAALEAFEQGRFDAFLEAVLDASRAPNADEIAGIAARVGMDPQRLRRAWSDQRHLGRLEGTYLYKKRRRVLRTPELLFNGASPKKTVRTLTLDELEEHYDAAYAAARDAMARGVPLAAVHEHLVARADAERPPQPILAGLVDGEDGTRRTEEPPPARVVSGRIDYRGPHSIGPEGAPVVLVYYCNFKSKLCRDFNAVLQDVRSAYRDEVRLVFKHLFDEEDPNQQGVRDLHEAAMCAEEQGAFWRLYELLYDRQGERPAATSPAELGASIGVDEARFTACLEQGRYRERVEQERRAAHEAGIVRTPSIVVGGRHYLGTKSFFELRSLIEEALGPGLLERHTAPWLR